jgi:hypothetical protein
MRAFSGETTGFYVYPSDAIYGSILLRKAHIAPEELDEFDDLDDTAPWRGVAWRLAIRDRV